MFSDTFVKKSVNGVMNNSNVFIDGSVLHSDTAACRSIVLGINHTEPVRASLSRFAVNKLKQDLCCCVT